MRDDLDHLREQAQRARWWAVSTSDPIDRERNLGPSCAKASLIGRPGIVSLTESRRASRPLSV